MKKIIIFLLAFAMVTAFAACGANEEKSFAVVTAKSCYENAGYKQFTSEAEEPCEITFEAVDSEGVEWSFYVLDGVFDDGLRYIAQSAEPVLVGDGTICVEAGQVVYIYCSVNEFTADEPDENAILKIYYN